jgi:DNA-binding SARP family transcriptional activator
MEQHMVEGRLENVEELATDLLRQAERCAKSGLLRQAQALMAQVWTITADGDHELANIAAWESAWFLIRLHIYDEAAEWFERVTAPPMRQSWLWPAAMQAQSQLCRKLAGRAAEPETPFTLWQIAPAATPEHSAPAALPLLTITNLGRFQIARAGSVLAHCKARKAVAIFRYLLTRRHRSAHKEELMELLWPDVRPREAAHSLHVAVSALRHYLDPVTDTYVLFEEGCYTINSQAPVEDDCTAFQQLSDTAEQARRAGDQAAAQRAYVAAIATYQGDFYVDDRDPAWASSERERLLTRYLTNLDHLGRILIGQQRFEPAIDYYQRLLDRDSYREDVHSQIMRCYWQLGRRGAALRQYERCAAILANDLGLEPMQEMQGLYQEIMHADA